MNVVQYWAVDPLRGHIDQEGREHFAELMKPESASDEPIRAETQEEAARRLWGSDESREAEAAQRAMMSLGGALSVQLPPDESE